MRSVNIWQKLLILSALALVATIQFAPAALAEYVIQQNDYLYAKQAFSEECPQGTASTGRWSIGTVKGDPEIPEDDDMMLIRECSTDISNSTPSGYWGFTTVRIDGADYIYGSGGDGIGWSIPPYTSAWPYDGLIGNYISSTWHVTKEGTNVSVKMRIVLIRDQARFEYVIKNDDTKEHKVGLRMLGDVMVDGTDRVAFPWFPDKGIYETEQDLTGTNIPTYFETYDDPSNPKVAVRNTLKLQDATAPDRVAVGDWDRLSSIWDFTAISDKDIADHSWALWWNEMVLQPGQTRTIVTYYGMAAASESWTSGSTPKLDPYVIALTSPRAVTADSTGELPSFDIKAYLYNMYHNVDINNVTFNIALPEGLALVNDTNTKTIAGGVTRESEGGPVSWKVKPTGTVAGPVTISISVSGSPEVAKTVSRTIYIPATYRKSVISGWQMFSVPYNLQDPRPTSALLPYDSATNELLTSDLQALRWDNDYSAYKAVDVLKPGYGFWFKYDDSSISQMTLNSPGTTTQNATALPSDQSISIQLQQGWNQIGNPYLFPILWGRAQILSSSQTGPVSIATADSKGWIRSTIYWFDTGKNAYDYSSSPLTQIMPWQGYWIKALTPCLLIIPPVEQIGVYDGSDNTSSSLSRMVGATSGPAQLVTDGWKLALSAKAGSKISGTGCIGTDSRAVDGYNSEDVEQPPLLADYITVSFPHQDWGANSGRYIQDIRKTGTTNTWDVDVTSDKQNTDVVLTWPGMSSVPKNCRLRLEDPETGVRKDMRTVSSYRYNTGSNTTHRFRIVAESVDRGRLMISNLNVAPSRAGGGVTISYALSADAVTEVKVRSISGSNVNTLSSGRGVTRGISSLVWNYRNGRGERVTSGTYIVEVVATTPEGEVAKQVVPFIVAK